MVWPVSVSLEVAGQRTSRLLMPAFGLTFFGLGRANKNRDSIIVPIDKRSGFWLGEVFHLSFVESSHRHSARLHLCKQRGPDLIGTGCANSCRSTGGCRQTSD